MSTICATGRIGSDAVLRETQGGTKVAQFSIADEIGWGDKKKVQWLKCVMFGARAEKIAQYLTKGSLVEVTGSPTLSLWADKSTKEPRGSLEVTVSEVKLHGGGKRDDAPVADNARATAVDDEERIPF